MPPRPVIKDRQTSRPLSAVYIGKGGSGVGSLGSLSNSGVSASPSLHDLSQTASAYSSLIDGTPPSQIDTIPDLPEPPSPSSSVGSGLGSVNGKTGLPSPPATNSTGSGSGSSSGDTKRGEADVDVPPLQLRKAGNRERDDGRPLSLHSNGTSSTSTSGEYSGTATPMRRSSVSFSDSGDNAGGPSRSRSSSRLGHAHTHGQDAEVEGDFDEDYDKAREEHHRQHDADDRDDDNDSNFDGDGDDTARLGRILGKERERESALGSRSENVLALQKVRNLAHRNQLALDKLSRLSPSPAGRSVLPPNSRSPAPSTSSRHSSSARQLRPPPQELARSGSETERESTTHHSTTNSNSSAYDLSPSISSSYLSTTPPPATPSHHRIEKSSSASSSSAGYRRVRQTSAPDSPSKARRMVALDDPSPSSGHSSALTRSPSAGTGLRRHRTSMASVSQLQLADFSEEEDDRDHDPPSDRSGQGSGLRTATNTTRDKDRERTRDRTLSERDMIIQSALAAAASSRRSPLGSRRRSALPKEFRSDLVEDSPSPGPVGNGNGSLRRSNLPRDSPDDDRRERDRDNWRREVEPVTPLRSATTSGTKRNSNSTGVTRSSTLRDPRVRYSEGPGTSHASTPSGRWSSEDWRSPNVGQSHDRDITTSRPYRSSLSNEDGGTNANLRAERRQSLRGGSAESALMWSPGGRSLLGEGLRAAGLSRRRAEDDTNVSVNPGSRGAAIGSSTPSGRDLFKDRERDRERKVDWSPQDLLDDRKRRVLERNQPQLHTRAATSMAHYQYLDKGKDRDDEDDENPMHERELVLHRGHRSTYSLAAPRDLADASSSGSGSRRGELTSHHLERAGSALNRYDLSRGGEKEMPSPALRASHLLDRERPGTSSPFGSTRRYTQPPASTNLNASTSSAVSNTTTATASGAPEHTRLMLESLAMFENQVNKLPRLGIGSSLSASGSGIATGATQADLSRNAQNVVFAAERLLLMLKHGSAKAMEASVEAEVDLASSTSSRDPSSSSAAKAKAGPSNSGDSNTNPGEIWTRVAAEYRDSARTADELVRGVTALLLGFGRVVKEFGVHMGAGASDFGSPSVHGRTLSLDEDAAGGDGHGYGHGHERGGREGDKVIREGGEGSGGGGGGGGGGGVSNGRHSVASSSRRSWDPAPRDQERERDRDPREREREDALRRLVGAAGVGARSESVLARASPATFQRLRDRDRDGLKDRNMSPLPAAVSEASRRLFTPRDQQQSTRPGSGGGERRGTPRMSMSTLDSKETIHPPSSTSTTTAEDSNGHAPGHGSRTQRYSESNALSNSREYYYEPSPTPASRTITSATMTASSRRTPPQADREKVKTLTPLTIPRPLPVLPSETRTTRRPGTANAALGGGGSATTPSTASSALPSNERSDSSSGFGNGTGSSNANSTGLTRSGTTRDRDRDRAERAADRAEREKERERRRATVTSRAVFPSSLTTPTTATTTASRTTQAQVTFSRPSASAMDSATATLSEMQERERARTTSTASNANADGLTQSPVEVRRGLERLSRSNSESKESGGSGGVRERRKTIGRVSLDGVRDRDEEPYQERRSSAALARNSTVHAADRSAATTVLQSGAGGAGRRERRRTVTDIWPPS